MKKILLVVLLTLCNCKSISGLKALSQGGTTTITPTMVEKMLSMYVVLQKKDSLKMAPIKVIKINIQKTLNKSCTNEIKDVSL